MKDQSLEKEEIEKNDNESNNENLNLLLDSGVIIPDYISKKFSSEGVDEEVLLKQDEIDVCSIFHKF